MKNFFFKTCEVSKFLIFVIFSIGIMGCGGNLLHNYEFNDTTISATTSVPPQPEVFTDVFIRIDTKDPIGSFLSVGSTIAKEAEAMRVQAKLDSAIKLVNIPERVERGILQKSSDYLHYEIIDDTHTSDFMFDINIHKYGVDAKSFSTAVDFIMDIEVQLIDNVEGKVIWGIHLNERQPITRKIFGIEDVSDNVITAIFLSKLSVDQLADGFEQLADYTGNQVAKILNRDYIKSREKRRKMMNKN